MASARASPRSLHSSRRRSRKRKSGTIVRAARSGATHHLLGGHVSHLLLRERHHLGCDLRGIHRARSRALQASATVGALEIAESCGRRETRARRRLGVGIENFNPHARVTRGCPRARRVSRRKSRKGNRRAVKIVWDLVRSRVWNARNGDASRCSRPRHGTRHTARRSALRPEPRHRETPRASRPVSRASARRDERPTRAASRRDRVRRVRHARGNEERERRDDDFVAARGVDRGRASSRDALQG